MRKSVIAIIVIVLVVLYMSVFVVKEGERGITLRFGKVLRDDENKPLVYAPVSYTHLITVCATTLCSIRCSRRLAARRRRPPAPQRRAGC